MTKPFRLGKYLLVERLHSGAIAELFLGRTSQVGGLEQVVAVKRVNPLLSHDPDFVSMFLDEARISAQLGHSNIARVLEVGEDEGTYFIAMEYILGKDLRGLLDLKQGLGEPLSVPQAAFIASSICSGLDYAHRKRDVRGKPLDIIHRGISPQNVMLSFEGEVKLIDFGLAKASNRTQQTQVGGLRGKVGYMSPEQVRGIPLDHRSDLFSVGVLLYQMLSGERPFAASNDLEALDKVARAEAPPLRMLNPALPDELEDVVLRALAREPEERYQWASELQQALLPFVAGSGGHYTASLLSEELCAAFPEDAEAEAERVRQVASTEEPPSLATSPRRASRSHPALTAPAPEALDEVLPFAAEGDVFAEESTQLVDLDRARVALAAPQSQREPARPTPAAPHLARTPSGRQPVVREWSPPSATPEPPSRVVPSGPVVLSEAFETDDATMVDLSETAPRPSAPIPQREARGSRSTLPERPSPSRPSAPIPQPGARGSRNTLPEQPSPAAPAPARRKRTLPRAEAVPPPSPFPGPRRAGLVAAAALLGLFVLAGAFFALRPSSESAGSTVVVRVTPGEAAHVTIGGRLIEPGKALHFPAGEYDLVAVSPGFKRHLQRITIFSNESQAVFTVLLEPESEAANPQQQEEAGTFLARFVSVDPGVEILVEGVSLGRTPGVSTRLESGRAYRYQARAEGHEPLEGVFGSSGEPEVTVTVALEKEKEPEVVAAAKPPTRRPRSAPRRRQQVAASGSLVCTSQPNGAEIWVNGKPSGRTTPVLPGDPLVLPAGTHKILLEIGGMVSEVRTVTIRPNSMVNLRNLPIDRVREL